MCATEPGGVDGAGVGGDWPAAPAAAAAVPAEELDAVLARARHTWPRVAMVRSRFVAYVAARLPAGPGEPPALSGLHAVDLYLACGCAAGDPAALSTFERQVLPLVTPALARLNLSPTLIDDVKQGLRAHLFTSLEGPPRICDYSGRGPLAHFVQVAAVRQATNLLRRRKTHGDLVANVAFEVQAVGPNPEVGYLKSRYAAEFSAAFHRALAALSRRERNVLRLHFVEGLTLDEIGGLFCVHRVTVCRWLARARDALLTETRRLLGERLRLTPGEFDSLMALVRSQIEVSLVTTLSAHHDR